MKDLTINDCQLIYGGFSGLILRGALKGAAAGTAYYGASNISNPENMTFQGALGAAAGGAVGGGIGAKFGSWGASTIGGVVSGISDNIIKSMGDDIRGNSNNKSGSNYDCGDGTDYQG
ncbi:hypothetical protein [Mannheimia granulomatis]|nr:hypothetical protein [Mannheimia granulomatis]